MRVPTKEEIAARKADRERRKGAPLSMTEELWLFIPGKEGLDSRSADPRDGLQRMADDEWSIVMAKDEANASSVSDELARVEAQIAKSQREKAFAGLDSTGQYAAVLREKHEAELSARVAEQQYAEHLERNGEPIRRLQALQTEMAWCADYHAGDLAAVDRALRQYSTPGACPVEAQRLMRDAIACKERLVGQRAEELAVKEADMRAARNLLDQQLAQLKEVQENPTVEVEYGSDDYWRLREKEGGYEPGHFVAPLEAS